MVRRRLLILPRQNKEGRNLQCCAIVVQWMDGRLCWRFWCVRGGGEAIQRSTPDSYRFPAVSDASTKVRTPP